MFTLSVWIVLTEPRSCIFKLINVVNGFLCIEKGLMHLPLSVSRPEDVSCYQYSGRELDACILLWYISSLLTSD